MPGVLVAVVEKVQTEPLRTKTPLILVGTVGQFNIGAAGIVKAPVGSAPPEPGIVIVKDIEPLPPKVPGFIVESDIPQQVGLVALATLDQLAGHMYKRFAGTVVPFEMFRVPP